MNIVRFQGENLNVYYEFDKDSMPLGKGGMGCIYQGKRVDNSLNIQTIVAIKCINPEFSGNPTILQRAQREASVVIDDLNLIRMYGLFQGTEQNAYTGQYVSNYYIVMELLRGVNLDEILFKGVVTDKTGMPVELAQNILETYSNDRSQLAVSLIIPILSGLASLHKRGFIHRDMDPSNVMVTQEGFIKVIDFGISKKISGTSIGAGLTQAGQFLGKYAYAAPELLLGDLQAQAACTDLYAIGIMLYQIITGHLPASGSNQEIMQAHIKGNFDFSEIPSKELRKVVEKAVATNYPDRYQTAEEFIDALNSVSFTPAARIADAVENKRDIPTFIIPVMAAAGLVLGVLFGVLF